MEKKQGELFRVCFENLSLRAVLCGTFQNMETMLDSVDAPRILLPVAIVHLQPRPSPLSKALLTDQWFSTFLTLLSCSAVLNGMVTPRNCKVN